MKIILNGVEQSVSSTNITALIDELSIDSRGIAIGLNNSVVPRNQWDTHSLCEGDSIVVVSAVFGG